MHKKYFLTFISLFAIVHFGFSQSTNQPKLVVGIVVDQMRFDQLYKYQDRYGEGGFKRLMKRGYQFKNATVNYIPSETAPGHASIYTGTTPAYHGIIGNSWFSKVADDFVGNVDDPNEKVIGSLNENPYGVSPAKLMATTIGDQLRMGSNFKAKVISVSIKDRGAVLPGGKSANAAYWNDWETSPGYFVSSSFYMKKVPRWVKKFNAADRANQYLNQTWTTLYPVETYAASAPDNSQYEPSLGGKPSPTFPYNFKAIREKYKPSGTEYRLLWVSPAGNTILTEFAIAALENEELGADEVPDMLAISYSVPDVIGHTFGPQAVEMEDMYLRLDQNLESLFEALDNSVGKDNYTLFLTSDHAAIANIAFLADHKLDADVAKVTANTKALDKFLDTKYGSADWIHSFTGNNIYLNKAVIDEKKLMLPVISQDVADYVMRLPEVYLAMTANQLQTQVYTEGIRQTMQNGYHPKRSGDVLVAYNSGTTIQRDEKVAVEKVRGTVHGSPYTYDTHVPLLWMGKGIPQGESVRAVNPIDIAPTIAMLLNLQLPSASQGKPLPEILGGSTKQ